MQSRAINRTVATHTPELTSVDLLTSNVSDIRFLAKDSITILTIPSGNAVECIDGKTSITWKVVGDATKVALNKTDICNPELTTSSDYAGDISIEAELKNSTQALKYQLSLKREDQDPAVCLKATLLPKIEEL